MRGEVSGGDFPRTRCRLGPEDLDLLARRRLVHWLAYLSPFKGGDLLPTHEVTLILFDKPPMPHGNKWNFGTLTNFTEEIAVLGAPSRCKDTSARGEGIASGSDQDRRVRSA